MNGRVTLRTPVNAVSTLTDFCIRTQNNLKKIITVISRIKYFFLSIIGDKKSQNWEQFKCFLSLQIFNAFMTTYCHTVHNPKG